MTREHIIEAYMINDKHVIAEMLYDTITKYEEKLKSKSCEGCKYYFKDEFASTCSNESIAIVNAYGSTEPDVYLKVSADFSCNKFEPKDKE